MHTVRNRIASRTPYKHSASVPAPVDEKPPVQRSARHDMAHLLRSGAPPQALPPTPALSLPAIPVTAAAWRDPVLHGPVLHGQDRPETARPADTQRQKRRNPKGKKARKAAARKAQAAEARSPARAKSPAVALKPPVPEAIQRAISLESSLQAPPAPPVAATPATPPTPAAPTPAAPAVHFVPAPESDREPDGHIEPQSDPCLQANAAPALALPQLPEPLVEAPTVAALAPLVEACDQSDDELGPVAAAALAPVSALALAALVDAQTTPLPRSRALVPARRQGLVDTIAFLLRDSGRRLARWSAKRHKSRVERDLLLRAEARQRALLSELAALEALRKRQQKG